MSKTNIAFISILLLTLIIPFGLANEITVFDERETLSERELYQERTITDEVTRETLREVSRSDITTRLLSESRINPDDVYLSRNVVSVRNNPETRAFVEFERLANIEYRYYKYTGISDDPRYIARNGEVIEVSRTVVEDELVRHRFEVEGFSSIAQIAVIPDIVIDGETAGSGVTRAYGNYFSNLGSANCVEFEFPDPDSLGNDIVLTRGSCSGDGISFVSSEFGASIGFVVNNVPQEQFVRVRPPSFYSQNDFEYTAQGYNETVFMCAFDFGVQGDCGEFQLTVLDDTTIPEPPPSGNQTTFTMPIDSYLTEAQPTTNHGSSWVVSVASRDASRTQRGILGFNLSDLGYDVEDVEYVNISIRTYSFFGVTSDLNAQYFICPTYFVENTVTWNSFGNPSGCTLLRSERHDTHPEGVLNNFLQINNSLLNEENTILVRFDNEALDSTNRGFSISSREASTEEYKPTITVVEFGTQPSNFSITDDVPSTIPIRGLDQVGFIPLTDYFQGFDSFRLNFVDEDGNPQTINASVDVNNPSDSEFFGSGFGTVQFVGTSDPFLLITSEPPYNKTYFDEMTLIVYSGEESLNQTFNVSKSTKTFFRSFIPSINLLYNDQVGRTARFAFTHYTGGQETILGERNFDFEFRIYDSNNTLLETLNVEDGLLYTDVSTGVDFVVTEGTQEWDISVSSETTDATYTVEVVPRFITPSGLRFNEPSSEWTNFSVSVTEETPSPTITNTIPNYTLEFNETAIFFSASSFFNDFDNMRLTLANPLIECSGFDDLIEGESNATETFTYDDGCLFVDLDFPSVLISKINQTTGNNVTITAQLLVWNQEESNAAFQNFNITFIQLTPPPTNGNGTPPSDDGFFGFFTGLFGNLFPDAEELTFRQAMTYVLVTMFITLIIGVFLAYSTQTISTGIIIALMSLMVFFEAIYFTAIGYIPLWIIGVVGVLSVALSIGFFTRKTVGGD